MVFVLFVVNPTFYRVVRGVCIKNVLCMLESVVKKNKTIALIFEGII